MLGVFGSCATIAESLRLHFVTSKCQISIHLLMSVFLINEQKIRPKRSKSAGSDNPRLDRQAIESPVLPDDIRSAIEPVEPSMASKAFNSEEAGWTEFFESGPVATDDFERPEQGQQATREGFDYNPFSRQRKIVCGLMISQSGAKKSKLWSL